MAPIDFTSLKFAGFVLAASRDMHRGDRRVPRFVTAHRFLVESCVYSHEIHEPGHWDKFRLDRSLKELIPPRKRNDVLQAISDLAADGVGYGEPNICMSREALRSLLAVARIPRDKVQILEAGMRPVDADEVLAREDSFTRLAGAKDNPHGIVSALKTNQNMSGSGSLLGVEPWFLDRRLRCSWRERHDSRAVRARAFSRLNDAGLLADFIDFELFVPGLTPRRIRNREGKWIPLVLAHHSVESVIGDSKPRNTRTARQ